MEPTAPAAAKTALPGFQQYDGHTNNAPFWNSSAAGFGVPAAAAAPDHASVRSVKPSPAPRAATLALKVGTTSERCKFLFQDNGNILAIAN